MRKYKTTTYEDRKSIENLYARGFPLAEIAATVEISVATLYRELSRGYTGNLNAIGCRAYSADLAQQTTDQNIKRRGRTPADRKDATK